MKEQVLHDGHVQFLHYYVPNSNILILQLNTVVGRNDDPDNNDEDDEQDRHPLPQITLLFITSLLVTCVMIMGAIYSSKRYYTTRSILLEQQQQQDENETKPSQYNDIFSIWPFIGLSFTVSTLTGIVCYINGGWW